MNGSSDNAKSERLLEIDILRGVAAFAVFLFHASIIAGFPKRTLPPFDFFGYEISGLPNIFSFGATGVNLFFVISGFCLSLKPLQKGLHSVDNKSYFKDRLARIYPAYIVAVFYSLAVTLFFNNEWTVAELFAVLVFFQGFIQEWHFGLNGALWSMATEVQFYFAFPFMFILFQRLQPVKFIVGILIFVVGYRLLIVQIPSAAMVIGGIRSDTFFMNMLPGRLFEFSLGMVLAYYWIFNRRLLVRLCRISFIPVFIFAIYARMNLSTAIADPVLGLMCVILVGLSITVDIKLGWKFIIAAFGRSSYSFFLLHMPTLLLVHKIISSRDQVVTYGGFMALVLVGFFISLVFGVALYNCVEKPLSRSFKTMSIRKPVSDHV